MVRPEMRSTLANIFSPSLVLYLCAMPHKSNHQPPEPSKILKSRTTAPSGFTSLMPTNANTAMKKMIVRGLDSVRTKVLT